jgi:tetratricopeptide (TPR) repeat protein
MARVPIPEDVDARELDKQTRSELLTLAKDTADLVARHLVMAGRLLDDDPTEALRHARAARALAGRVAAAREANGIAAYLAGEWTEALSELRTARRMSGDSEHLPVMADCERALGRPDRALLLTQDPQSKDLSPQAQVELLIVGSGARRDLGQPDAAVAMLEVAALQGPVRPWTARLRYAYADALLTAGRHDDARLWFARTLEADTDNTTDADERLLDLDGITLHDHHPDPDEPTHNTHEPTEPHVEAHGPGNETLD